MSVVDDPAATQVLTNALEEVLPFAQATSPVWIDPDTGGTIAVSVYDAPTIHQTSQNPPIAPVGSSYLEGSSAIITENENDSSDNFLIFGNSSWPGVDSLPQPSPYTHMSSLRAPHSLFSDHLDFIHKLLQQNGYAEKPFW